MGEFGDLVGRPAEVSEFGEVRRWRGSGVTLEATRVVPDTDGVYHPYLDPETGEWHMGIEWAVPRDIRSVTVRFENEITRPGDVQLEYWRKNWPTPAPERWPGARRGWIGRDDPWHGEWVTVRAARRVEDRSLVFDFDPVDVTELGRREGLRQLIDAKDFLARFRRTLKIRVSASGEAPQISAVEAYTSATWRERAVNVWFGVAEAKDADWSGSAGVFNGRLGSIVAIDGDASVSVAENGSWVCNVNGKPKGISVNMLCTVADVESDATLLTIRTNARSFTVSAQDLDHGPIYIKDYDVYVAWADDAVPFEAFAAGLSAKPRSVYERVFDEPEQSLDRAISEIPRLDVTKQAPPSGRYLPVGVEAGRQEIAVRYNGEIFMDKSLLKLSGRDAARLLYPGHVLRFRFATGDPPDFRERRDGTRQSVLENWLPVVISQWLDREIEYTETVFGTLLDGPMTGPEERRGDEDVVAMVQFKIRNTTHGAKRARIWIAISAQEQIDVRGNKVVGLGRVVPDVPVARQWRVDRYDGDYLRCTIDTAGKGCLSAVGYSEGVARRVAGFDWAVQVPENASIPPSSAIPTCVAYDVELDGGAEHTITMAVPFVTFVDEDDWDRVAALDFESERADAVSYWRDYVESGGHIDVPDQLLNEFHKSVRAHVAISVDKEPANGLYSVPAATWAYGVCANEACWQITMLDQAGHHDRAEAYLDNFLALQGTTPLDGLFQSAEGVMQGNDLDSGEPRRSGFSYNLDPGFIMECLADHYRLTGDRAWLDRVAPQLVAACDFIIRERQATKVDGPDGRRCEAWGLLPVGHLEDNPEWRHWFAVNAHSYGGFRDIADVLAEIGHPESERLDREAKEYREDIRTAVRRAMVESPVVQLIDGTYVPHVPTRTGIRGREWGWFREVAYGAIQLLEGGVFAPGEEEMTWVLKDSEDNLFVSRDYGRPVDMEKYWFSHGGITIQANLTDVGIDYLRRGETKHALRSLFNNFGASMYTDVRCFTEHPVVELGHGVGPFYKTSDESKALVWLRAFLLREEGETLHLALGAPRRWFEPGQAFGVEGMSSYFGSVTYWIRSSDLSVSAEISLDAARLPGEIVLHLRVPGGRVIESVAVNGKEYGDFDPEAEIVRIAEPCDAMSVEVAYAR